MDLYHGFPTQPLENRAFLTIGNFDGVHRGHQALLADLARASHAVHAPAGVLTFEPHPLAVLRPDMPVLRLTTLEEQADICAALGLDFMVALPFDRAVAATSAADFMARLHARLPLQALWIGPDFALGRDRAGDGAQLTALGERLGFAVRVIPPVDRRGAPVRSTRIRALLQEGAVDAAAELLGRPYQLTGPVVEGARRGRTLGFPTANVAVHPDRLVPAHGVYACWAWREDAGYPAVVNIGVRPSFDNGQRTVEAYLLDVHEDLYGETLTLSVVRRLRPEKRFPDVAALKRQIAGDVETARALLGAGSGNLEAGNWKLEAEDAASAGWEELTHTADWAIRAWGGSPRRLFETCAQAMYALQDAEMRRPITLARRFHVEAAEPAGLLVAWLNRLLLNQELAGEMYTRFALEELSDRGLRGVAYGHRGQPSHTGIKAVTYYDLDVRELAAGWQATVTFDV